MQSIHGKAQVVRDREEERRGKNLAEIPKDLSAAAFDEERWEEKKTLPSHVFLVKTRERFSPRGISFL